MVETLTQENQQPGGQPPALSSFDFNKPETWGSPEIYAYPDFDITGFQKKLDDLFGLSDTNFPIVRIVWPGDIKKCYSKFYTSWTGAGFGIDSELRAKYRYASIQIPGTPDIIDVPPARWILEQFNHPGQYLASWEAARFSQDGREIRPAPPPNGYYSHLWTIAEHNEECCKEAKAKMKVCWGSYRLPDEQDIDILRKAKQARDADREIDTTKPLDEITLEAINKETENRIAEQEKKVQDVLGELVDEYALELFEHLGIPVSPTARAKFSIPKDLKGKHKIRTESSVIVPNIK
jgi:hypothetical protein